MRIFAAVVFASLLDGGVRLLGRVLPISRGWRLLIVVVLVLVFMPSGLLGRVAPNKS